MNNKSYINPEQFSANEIISSSKLNSIIQAIRNNNSAIQTHTHTGNADGSPLNGSTSAIIDSSIIAHKFSTSILGKGLEFQTSISGGQTIKNNIYVVIDNETLNYKDDDKTIELNLEYACIPFMVIDYCPLGPVSIPTGWITCDGSQFTFEGTTYTTPDLRDKFIVGSGNSYSFKNSGGEATHVLTQNETPDHAHGMGDYWNNNGQWGSLPSYIAAEYPGTRATNWNGSGGGTVNNKDKFASTIITTSFVLADITNGETSAHNNLPPYYALIKIMKMPYGAVKI